MTARHCCNSLALVLSVPVVSVNDGCVNMSKLVKAYSRGSFQMLLLNITIGLFVSENEMHLQARFSDHHQAEVAYKKKASCWFCLPC